MISLDQGTTSSRAILFDKQGAVVAMAQKELTQHYPRPGWVEHDPGEIWSTQVSVASEVIAKSGIAPGEIAAMGITNQRETTLVWERHTGRPVYRAIVWQDRRTAAFCNKLDEEGHAEKIRDKTGLLPDAYFSATKIRWILENVEGAREKAERGDLCFGTVDSWLIWKFTRGKQHLTDVTNASRTMLYNIHTMQWDPGLLQLFGIPASMLPGVRRTSGLFGETSGDSMGYRLPITGVAGDQQAALFGQLCLDPGSAKNTYGTGCFVVMNTGTKAVTSHNNLLTTVAWQLEGEVTYALEGSIFTAGSLVQWLRDELGLIASAPESEEVARSVPDNGGVYVVPALTGLGAPHWDPYARGTLFGLTRGTNRAHIVRAALESISYQVYDVISAMTEDAGRTISELRADGGASANDWLMQFQSDLLRIPVIRPAVMETTALGAAYFAGLEAGVWKSTRDLLAGWREDRVFKPVRQADEVATDINYWNRALARARGWITEEGK